MLVGIDLNVLVSSSRLTQNDVLYAELNDSHKLTVNDWLLFDYNNRQKWLMALLVDRLKVTDHHTDLRYV